MSQAGLREASQLGRGRRTDRLTCSLVAKSLLVTFTLSCLPVKALLHIVHAFKPFHKEAKVSLGLLSSQIHMLKILHMTIQQSSPTDTAGSALTGAHKTWAHPSSSFSRV